MSKAPPPSPIPTGKGSRSAATEIFTDYLENSLQVPDLTLPEPYIPSRTSNHVPDVSYRLLESGDNDTQNQVLKSAREFGVFRIVDHGISADELQFLVGEADQVFGDGFPRNSGDQGSDQTKEETVWVVRSGKERMELANKHDEAERFQDFSAKTENVASKLDAIAQQLCRVFVEKTHKRRYQRTIQDKEIETILSLYRYNHKYDINLANEEKIKSSDPTLCLLLPTFHSHFLVQSDRGAPLSFNTGPDAIVVANGKYIKEWSMEDFRSVSGQEISEPESQQFSFLIQLKCLSFNSSNNRDDCSMISIRHQILIVIGLVFLYNVYVFLWS